MLAGTHFQALLMQSTSSEPNFTMWTRSARLEIFLFVECCSLHVHVALHVQCVSTLELFNSVYGFAVASLASTHDWPWRRRLLSRNKRSVRLQEQKWFRKHHMHDFFLFRVLLRPLLCIRCLLFFLSWTCVALLAFHKYIYIHMYVTDLFLLKVKSEQQKRKVRALTCVTVLFFMHHMGLLGWQCCTPLLHKPHVLSLLEMCSVCAGLANAKTESSAKGQGSQGSQGSLLICFQEFALEAIAVSAFLQHIFTSKAFGDCLGVVASVLNVWMS